MLKSRAEEIHLWLSFYNEIVDHKLRSAYAELLCPRERHQGSRFVFARDRSCYLVTRALVRTVLSKYLSPAPHEWRFGASEYGRPYITNQCAGANELEFNVSHTESLIVLAIGWERAIGVDVENVRSSDAPIDIAHQFFAPVEVAELNDVAQECRRDRFFEYWTFKESYIKARGLGLSIPLRKFSFCCQEAGGVQISIDPELEDRSSGWQFWQLRPTAEHLVALCAERLGDSAAQIIAKKVVPLGAEELLETEFTRTSVRGLENGAA